MANPYVKVYCPNCGTVMVTNALLQKDIQACPECLVTLDLIAELEVEQK